MTQKRAAILGLAVLLVSARARAEEEDDRAERARWSSLQDPIVGPKLPPPFAVPELTHPTFDARIDWNVASGEGTATGIVRPSAEAKLGSLRRVYVGLEWPFAGAEGKVVSGNVTTSARFVFPMPSFLAASAGIGVAFPTARFAHGSPAQSAAVAAASLDPTELVALTPDAFALRPVVDFRVVRGPFVAQMRDGLDFAFDTLDARIRTTARILAHVGLLTSRDVEVSLEGSQQYFFGNGDYYGPEVNDAKRSAIVFGPGVRFAFRDVDLGAQATTNVGDPLSDRFDRFVAVRLSLVSHPFRANP
ncbi:MAG TPA: hypothetical protein VIF62_00775 [Labilithrix sp.]|jgi:hypothetical protein